MAEEAVTSPDNLITALLRRSALSLCLFGLVLPGFTESLHQSEGSVNILPRTLRRQRKGATMSDAVSNRKKVIG